MENFARELFLFEQHQHHLGQNLARKQQIVETIASFEQQRPSFFSQLITLGHVLSQVRKIHIQVSVVMQEPAIKKAGC